MAETRPATLRNIVIYIVAVLVIGNLAGIFYHAVDGLGGLVFILSPLLVAFGLRIFGGDGWGDVGFAPRIAKHPLLYLVALLIFPAFFALTLGIGVAIGSVHMQPGWPALLTNVALAGAVPVLVFAFSEEVAWRGYLEPRLSALGVPAPKRHLIVALVWGVWHTGYVLSQTDYTTLPLPLFFVLFFTAMVPMSFLFGIWRTRTGSFWPAFLAHGIANVLAWPLLSSEIVVIDTPLLFAARPDGLLMLGLLGLAAWVAYAKAR